MKSPRITAYFFLSMILLMAGCNRHKDVPESAKNNSNDPQPAAAPTTPTPMAESNPEPERQPQPKPIPKTASEPRRTPPPTPAPKPVVIPAGTALTVRVDQALGSKTSQQGEHFE